MMKIFDTINYFLLGLSLILGYITGGLFLFIEFIDAYNQYNIIGCGLTLSCFLFIHGVFFISISDLLKERK